MCPICDINCEKWNLNESCPYAQIVHFFDNYATVGYAVFMCVWNHLHLVIWRRQSARLLHHWNISEELDELPRPQYLANLEHYARVKSKSSMKQLPWKITLPPIMLSIFSVIFLFAIALLGVMAVIIFRTFLIYILAPGDQDRVKLTASFLAAIIDIMSVLILNKLFDILASKLTSKEKIRTQRGFEDSLTIKVSILQFVNYYGSIFYVAFFKGKFVGYPGSYNRVFGYRQEECSPGGCLVELCIQMGIIMIGNQLVASLLQIIVPRLQKWWKAHHGILRKGFDSAQFWARDYELIEWSTEALFVEYLQIVLQYGFVSIFVAAFPLAPLLALIANVLELRIDAQKFLQCHRRPVAQQVRSIGIWFKVMQFISYFSMFTNAAIIAFSSDFIPKMFYKFNRSPDFSLAGYINYSLSYSQFPFNQTECRYRDFREPYWSDKRYWLITWFKLGNLSHYCRLGLPPLLRQSEAK